MICIESTTTLSTVAVSTSTGTSGCPLTSLDLAAVVVGDVARLDLDALVRERQRDALGVRGEVRAVEPHHGPGR